MTMQSGDMDCNLVDSKGSMEWKRQHDETLEASDEERLEAQLCKKRIISLLTQEPNIRFAATERHSPASIERGGVFYTRAPRCAPTAKAWERSR